MKVEFLSKFGRDLDKITDKQVSKSVASLVETIEQAEALSNIPNLKKLTGFKNAYRVRIGNYRVGLFVEGETVEFVRIAHRKDIYNSFP